ncbi:MAG TPA: substrate-binding domain-containing protein [Pseudonocardiaceae bacterium]|nr:substrate-binding domain-containing protein [Pseudonocardiaceae bacterium]
MRSAHPQDRRRHRCAGLGVQLAVVDAQNDAISQINQVQTFITQGMQSIIINPVDSTQARPAAENANIPLISVDRSIDGGKVASEIVSDNVQGGNLAAIELDRVTSGAVVHCKASPAPRPAATAVRASGTVWAPAPFRSWPLSRRTSTAPRAWT